MKKALEISEYFLGANTPNGFFSIFDNLYQKDSKWFCYILKGGPGTGKSTLMKKISENFIKKGENQEIIRCSSDPNSLDAVILKKSKICIVDGTSPHILDSIYPGVCDEIINLGDFWNKKILEKFKDEIIKLYKENKNLHAKSKKYLSAFESAFRFTCKIIKENIDYEKLDLFCLKMVKEILKKTSTNFKKEKIRFLTSITPDGYIMLEKTINNNCKNSIIINDDYGIVGDYILKYIRKYALDLNFNIVSCLSPLNTENLEALIIKDIKTAIIVKNRFLSNEFIKKISINTEKINTNRFLFVENISKQKNILNFNNKACKEFLNTSIYNLSLAKAIHDDIEKIYIKSMNYNKVNKIVQRFENL